MSIKIHHGAPGTYKTSGAVMDDFVRWAREGRTIVTNVRGLTQEHIDEIHPEWGCEIIAIDTSRREGRERLLHWFHWLPPGAFMLIDEGQKVWPKRMSATELRALDLEVENDERPDCWEDAWERHRHFNWDVVITTPNIKLVRDDIKACAEMCYAHANLGLFGNIWPFKGSYLEAQHTPGSSPKQAITTRAKRIKKHVWALYESTATGDFTDTTAGQSLFANPKLLIGLGVLAMALVFALRGVGSDNSVLFKDHPTGKAPDPLVASKDRPAPAASPGRVPARPVAAQPGDTGTDPLKGQDLDIIVAMQRAKDGAWFYLIRATKDGASYVLRSEDIYSMHYELEPLGLCAAKLTWAEGSRYLTCGDRSTVQGLFSGARM